MLEYISKLWLFLSLSQKYRVAGVVLLMILAAFSEVLSMGMMLPFLAALLNPEQLFDMVYVNAALEMLDLDKNTNLPLLITVFFSVVVVLAGLMRVLLMWSQIRLSYGIGAVLAEAIYRRVLFQPYSYHTDTNSSQVIASVTRKADQVVNEVILPCMVLVSSLTMVVSIVVMLTLMSPVIAFSAAGGFGIIYVIVVLITKYRVAKYGAIINFQQSLVIKTLQEALGSIRDIIIDGAQEAYCAIYKRADFPLRRALANNLIIGGLPRPMIEAVSVAMLAVFTYVYAYATGDLEAMIPSLGVLVLGAQKLLPLLQSVYINLIQMTSGKSALVDVIQILEMSIANKGVCTKLDFHKGIIFNDVFFKYKENTEWVLSGVNLKINPGDRVGFVGGTGCGKSTLIDLLMGLLEPSAGEILVDGQQINFANSGEWQCNIAHVPQTIYLSDSTVYENIAFGIPFDKIDYDRVHRAASRAQISNVIETWHDGYNSIIGERGARLSGGQRQRIGIARAFYKNASVIVLDEATSALDSQTETAVMAAIDNLGDEMTIIIVAHRITTLKGCNKIVQLKDGRVEGVFSYENFRNISKVS